MRLYDIKLNLVSAFPAGKRWEWERRWRRRTRHLWAGILPSTILDLARYPADALSALLNMKKQDPVTTIKTQKQSGTDIKALTVMNMYWQNPFENNNTVSKQLRNLKLQNKKTSKHPRIYSYFKGPMCTWTCSLSLVQFWKSVSFVTSQSTTTPLASL